MLTMLFILISYLAASEAAKRIYFRQVA
jgi:hypothetical protein